jgi:hypothetical protein
VVNLNPLEVSDGLSVDIESFARRCAQQAKHGIADKEHPESFPA